MKKNLFLIILFLAGAVFARLRLPAIISENMVLQQKAQVTIWGWSNPMEEVRVETGWGGLRVSAKADHAGKWSVVVPTPSWGGPYTLVVATDAERIQFDNIMIGEVWLCSGQSNMQFSLKSSNRGEDELRHMDYPQIRLFTVKPQIAGGPAADTEGQWDVCSAEVAQDFSAVGYYFGKQIHDELGVPVGLIDSSWGGTPAQAWTPAAVLRADEDLSEYFARDEMIRRSRSKYQKEYAERLKKWREQCAAAREKSLPLPRKPGMPGGLRKQNQCGVLYNGMIHPIIPFAIKGAIWYQGESNSSDPYRYRRLFPTMIQAWRDKWGQGDFPFYFVQLASYHRDRRDDRPASLPKIEQPPERSDWAELREAQLMTLSLSETGMAVAMDIGDAYDIHPRNKTDVGQRLARWALAKTYGKDLVYSGPLYRRMEVQGNRIGLHFDHSGSGLMSRGGPLKGFSIAGKDKQFFWADAEIDGDTVWVWADAVKEPIAVRYGWANWIECNLYNKENLPASPFRTDSDEKDAETGKK